MDSKKIDLPVFIISGGFAVLFVLFSVLAPELTKGMVNSSFAFAIKYFGAYWQILLLLTFFIGLFLALTKYGGIKLGNKSTPEMGRFRWTAIIMCTLLAGGGVFWAAAEPIAHFLSSPPLFGVESKTPQAVYPALSQSFMHWGFLAWAILGSLATIVFMYYCYEKDMPFKPRVLLYPVFKEKALKGPIAVFADASCIIAVVAGTVGPIGFLGLQVSYGVNKLLNIPDTFVTQMVIVVLLVCIYVTSAVSGVSKGIQFLSRLNVIIAVGVMLFIFVFGKTSFIVNSYMQSFALYVNEFLSMALFRADEGWLSWWTVFFWGWFLGYGPLMAIFLSHISRGRSLRDVILTLSILAPVVTTFWFTIVGGSGIFFELESPGSISVPFEGFNLPATLLAIVSQLPLGTLLSYVFIILTFLFVATTGDSMTLSISMCMSGDLNPKPFVRVFWGIFMGLMALALISIGSGSISALQSFIVITAMPVSLILLPSLWNSVQIANTMYKQQKNSVEDA